MKSTEHHTVLHVSTPMAVLGLLIGLLSSAAVLSGDASGRVNLLFLLVLYLVVPVLGAVVSLVSLLSKRGFNIARILLAIPIWPTSQKALFLQLHQMKLDKAWFFMQSQAVALAFSFASMLVFLILLVGTDLNFVWRSTILRAEHLYSALQLIAAPWFFWEFAQPSLEFLHATQDSRLTVVRTAPVDYGQWWGFVLATQFVYAFALRAVMLWGAKRWLTSHLKTLQTEKPDPKPVLEKFSASSHAGFKSIAKVLPHDCALSNWAGFDSDVLESLSMTELNDLRVERSDFDASVERVERYSGAQVLLVKAWEPPMGELLDFLVNGRGFIYPIDIQSGVVGTPNERHLNEWQRFVEPLSDWQIYLPDNGEDL